MRSVLGAGKELRHRGWTRIWKHYVGDAGLPYRLGRGCLRSPQRPGWSLLEHSCDRDAEIRLVHHVARTRRELEVAPRRSVVERCLVPFIDGGQEHDCPW